MTPQHERRPGTAPGPTTDSRRGFLALGVGVLGAGVAVTVLGPAATLVAYPLGNVTTSGSDAFLPVGRPELFDQEEPVKVDLYSDKVDAWNRVIQVKVGSAWVFKHKGELVALSTVCPHLGCGIDYNAERHKFFCACHKTWFGPSGALEDGPSPRGMDTLDVKQEDKLVSIRYQRFKQGISEKEPVT